MPYYHDFFHHYFQVSRFFTKKLNEQLASVDLFQAQWSVIYYLHNHGATSLVDISSYMKVEKPTITRTANRLEELGFIEQVEGKDKRERRVQLTMAGKEKYVAAKEVVDKFEQELMSSIKQEDLNITLNMLLELKEKLK